MRNCKLELPYLTTGQALARAVYSKEKVVILDDAFSGMDAKTALKVSSRLFGKDGLLREDDTTVIIATHSGRPNAAVWKTPADFISKNSGFL